MKPISTTVLSESGRDYFWLDEGFQMTARRGNDSILHFGGIFTSAPVAVTAMAEPPPIVSKGKVVGPGRPKPLDRRTDVFGLGLDYAMYHKRFWGNINQNDFGPWQNLGGTFTSAPAAVAWGDARLDVFGVGIDHALYTKTCIGEKWTSDWLRLGGSFTSAATVISRGPKRLEVFARGADFTLRGSHTDGTTWADWQNHGGELASAPVAVSWGSDRIDIFAIFKDGALWHRWWDGEIWNEWESLKGSEKYTGEPAVVASEPGRLDVFMVSAGDVQGLRHQMFSSNTWGLPEPLSSGSSGGMAGSPTAVSDAPNHIEVFVPKNNNEIRIVEWNGQAWSHRFGAGEFRAPQRYRMSVDLVRAVKTRALRDDTDAAMVSVAAGNEAARIKTQWIGEIGGGVGGPDTSQTNLLKIEGVTVELAEPMSFIYIIVNNGHAPQEKILAALTSGGNSLSLAGSSSMQENIAKGVVKIITIKIVDAISVSIPVVGSILKIIEKWLLSKLTDALFEKCDGVVAVEFRAMMGRDLFILTDNGKKTVKVTTPHEGTDSSWNCGPKSEYEVTWTIQPL